MNFRRGFTLVELLVALAVVGALLALVPVSYGKLKEAMDYRSLVRDVVTDMRQLRSEAMRGGRSLSYVIDLDARQFNAGPMGRREIPALIRVEAEFAEIERLGPNVGGIRFYPDGSATGGFIRLERETGQGVVIKVDWLLGRVTQHELGAENAPS